MKTVEIAKTYPTAIMENVRRNMWEEKDDTSIDQSIMEMSKREVLRRHFNWMGIIGYEGTILEAIEMIYGINLELLPLAKHLSQSSMVAIYSGEEWIQCGEHDLFKIHYSMDECCKFEEVQVFTTQYYDDLTNGYKLPESLQKSLETIGFWYNDDAGEHYYCPTNGRIPEEFKATVKETVENFVRLLLTGQE